MILLLGGTSETARVAAALAEKGLDVLVSTSTDIELDVGEHPRIIRRSGVLDKESMSSLVESHGITVIVDATHPYATLAHAHAREAAEKRGLPYVRLERPEILRDHDSVIVADGHDQAAAIACSFGKPVLLTTGAKNIEPYARACRDTGVDLAVRVLPHPESMQAALSAGIEEEKIVAERGPFTVEENRSVIRKFGIGVLVTKDSGTAGGVPAKMEAARKEQCRIVVVRRPEEPPVNVTHDVAELVEAVLRAVRTGAD